MAKKIQPMPECPFESENIRRRWCAVRGASTFLLATASVGLMFEDRDMAATNIGLEAETPNYPRSWRDVAEFGDVDDRTEERLIALLDGEENEDDILDQADAWSSFRSVLPAFLTPVVPTSDDDIEDEGDVGQTHNLLASMPKDKDGGRNEPDAKRLRKGPQWAKDGGASSLRDRKAQQRERYSLT